MQQQKQLAPRSDPSSTVVFCPRVRLLAAAIHYLPLSW
jgi:hypothetical protein